MVVAVEEDDLERLDLFSCSFIEAEEIPAEWWWGHPDDNDRRNPIQGAYVSAPFEDRQAALGPDWREPPRED